MRVLSSFEAASPLKVPQSINPCNGNSFAARNVEKMSVRNGAAIYRLRIGFLEDPRRQTFPANTLLEMKSA
ncbi:unnamed protein product [Mycena citricolor]|uniref:Uncharacterized protein n=1 Tax=Mycena citricolor TaxID=2018698 RepID=A0AAD2HBR3_9AGAR|nr:unnamed protein product [Mycena citricolor]